MSNCNFTDNIAGTFGGVILNGNVTVLVYSNKMSDNSAGFRADNL